MTAKFTTQRDNDRVGYVEHVYMLTGNSSLLVATIYETVDGYYRFGCRYKLTPSQKYKLVCDAKHDLFQILDRVSH